MASTVPPLKWAGVRQGRAVSRVARNPRDINHIVLHTPEGYEAGTLNVLNGTRASFDYFLPLSGNLYNTNNWYKYISWQAGDGIRRIQSYGYHSIGIEQGDFARRARQFGEAHYRRLAHLCAWLQEEHLPSVQVRHETARGQGGGGYIYHRTITPGRRTDPGDFPMGDFLAMVSGFLRGSEHEPAAPKPAPSNTQEIPLKRINVCYVGAKDEKTAEAYRVALNSVARQRGMSDNFARSVSGGPQIRFAAEAAWNDQNDYLQTVVLGRPAIKELPKYMRDALEKDSASGSLIAADGDGWEHTNLLGSYRLLHTCKDWLGFGQTEADRALAHYKEKLPLKKA